MASPCFDGEHNFIFALQLCFYEALILRFEFFARVARASFQGKEKPNGVRQARAPCSCSDRTAAQTAEVAVLCVLLVGVGDRSRFRRISSTSLVSVLCCGEHGTHYGYYY